MYIHEFRHALNTAVQSTLKVSPSFLNFGRQPRPIKSLRRELEGAKEIKAAVTEYWLERLTKLECLRELVAKYADEAHDRQRVRYNKSRKDVKFCVGDVVLRKVHVLLNANKAFNAKLADEYEGPFTIVEVKSPTTYVLDRGECNSRHKTKMENKAVENVQQEAPIIALDSGENNVTTVENLPLPGLDSSELNLAATMDDVWDDIVATIAENNSTPEIVATAEGGEVSEKVGVTVEFVETEVIAPLLNEQAAPGDGQRDEEVDELTSEQQQVPLQAPMLDQQLEQQQQVPMQEQQLEQQQQVPLQVLMQEQQLEQQQQVPLQVQVQEQQLEPQLRQEQMEANIDSEVVFKKRKRSCRGGRKKKPSANRQLTVDDLELSFDVPARDDEEAGPPNRRQAVGDQVPVYVPSGPASGAGGLTSAEPLASPRQQLQVRLTSVMFGGLKAIPTDPAVDPAPRHCFNCWKPGHFRQVCPSAKERNYCFNCGRVGVDMADCPRCSGAHAEWIERTYSAERSQATEERRRAYESWREANPDRVVSEPRKVEFDLRQRLEQRLVDRQRVLREAGPSSRLDSESRRQEVQRYEPMLKSVRGQRVPEQHSDEARNPASSAGTEAQAADHHATLLEILRRLDGLPDDVRVAAMRSLFQ
ncbi:hypothetical protein TKK_0018798 [Trichogramma kaykai]|uniref:CCHC-type domain-containing protein n=2 Tax=Trichogramma kaykai TaxID=54128 RepID=A0ABD2VVR7_9HYME